MQKLAMVLSVMSVSLLAQWPKHQNPALPRTPDGKADLSAPAPRSIDGKPDLTGVWVVRNGSFYLTWDLKPEEMRPWAAAIYKQREADYRRDGDGIACLPPGPKAAIGVGPFPIKVLQNPGLVVILHEYDILFRQVFTDGRALPEDPNPTWMGYSVGHWEGDTLVIETTNFNGKTWLNEVGDVVSHAEKVVERFTPTDVGKINYRATVTDPIAYTRPWTIEIPLDQQGEELLEVACHEDNGDLQNLKAVRDEYRAQQKKEK